MLCYVMLCYVMLCYAMLRYLTLRYVMLCYVMLCYVMLCYVMLGVLTLNSFLSVIFACFYVYEFHGQVGSSPASYSVGPEFRSPQDSSCLDWGMMFYYSQSKTMLIDVFNRILVPDRSIFGHLILFVSKVFHETGNCMALYYFTKYIITPL